jgi:hypothetical protein
MITAELHNQILALLATGMTPAAVADRLGVDVTQTHHIALNVPTPVDTSPAAKFNFRHRRYA